MYLFNRLIVDELPTKCIPLNIHEKIIGLSGEENEVKLRESWFLTVYHLINNNIFNLVLFNQKPQSKLGQLP